MTDLLLGLEALALLVLAPASIISARYLTRIYLSRPKPRLLIFRAVLTSTLVSTIVGAYFAYSIVARVLRLMDIADLPAFPAPWSTVVAGAAIIGLLLPPILYALAVRRMRQP